MADQATYYDLLGLPMDATDEQIKRAYRHLVKEVHPDTSDREDTTMQFRALQQAYETLGDPRQRALYDATLAAARDRGRHTSRLGVRTVLSATVLPVSREAQALTVLAEIHNMAAQAARAPVNICLVLDGSQSMDGERLQHAQAAAIYLLEQLAPDDIVSVVAFSDRAHVALDGDRSADRAAARESVRAIHAGGGTELLHGLSAGMDQLRKWRSATASDHLILLTDGNTYGDEAGCLEAAGEAASEKISLSLLGLGTEWNDRLLDDMAARSGGYCTYVPSPARLPDIFRQRFADLSGTVARDVELVVHAHSAVQIQAVFRLTPDIVRCTLEDNRVLLGALDGKRPIRVLIEALVQAAADQAPSLRAMRLRVTCEAITASPRNDAEREQCDADVDVNVSAEPVASRTPREIEEIMARLALFKMQEKAIAEAERGDYAGATKRLKSLATHLMSIGEAELARAALLEAGELSRTQSLSAESRKRIRFGTRALSDAAAPPEP